ncbi:MAG TPA: hypothetical protein VMU79_02290 [Casimicrobiaceae bacterium]|jgi:hypothetical protein|nr:hypothetical protein [Casimicrobiaceae bacterium]
MSNVLARLLCVAAVTALALPVCAQTPQAQPKTTEAAPAAGSPTGAGAPTAPSAISQEEKTARAACESKPSADKEKCLKDVEAKYGKTDKMAPSGDMGAKPKEDTAKSGSYK